MRDKPELVLEIDGLVIDTYHSATITLMLASVASTFTFDVYRDESINKYFRPGANHRCKVKMLNQSKQEYETLITGYVVGADLHAKKVPDYERLSGYSLTGILEYAPIPPDFESLQFKGESLYSICKRITDYYGLTIKVKEGAEQKSYEIYTAENVLAPTKNKEAKGESSEYLRELQAGHRETCSSFMSKLATERGITVSHDNEGNLLLYHIVETIPVRAEIDEKTSIYHHINLNASWHQMYSKSVAILEMKETEMETTEAVMRAEAINPLYKGVRLQNGEYRHIVQEKEASTIEGADLQRYANFLACQNFKNLRIDLSKDGWTFQNVLTNEEYIVRAGYYINLTAPSLFIINKTRMLVDKIIFEQKGKDAKKTCSVELVHACVYSGIIPKQKFIG